MIFSANDWRVTIANNTFFNGCGFGINGIFWHQNLINFGTINILHIVGLGKHANNFNGDVGEALENATVRKLIEEALQIRRDADTAALAHSPKNVDCLVKKEILSRLPLYNRWLRLLLSEDERRAYIQAMNKGGMGGAPIWNDAMDRNQELTHVGAHRSLSTSINEQPRRFGPASLTKQYGQLKRKRCKHCGETDHQEKECPNGGYMHRGPNGEPVPVSVDSAPRCFVCGQRHRVLSISVGSKMHQIVHCSSNCPFRHPQSFGEVWRRCKGCKKQLQACWNCARPSCLRQTTAHCEGHRLNRCPQPRYWPSLDEGSYGVGVERRLLPHELMRELNINRLPREMLSAKVGEFIRRASTFNQFDAHRRYRQSIDTFRQISITNPGELEAAERDLLTSQQMVFEIDPEFQNECNTMVFESHLPELCQLCCQRKNGALMLRLLCCPIGNGELRSVHSDCLKEYQPQSTSEMICCPFCHGLQHGPSLFAIADQLDISQDEEARRLHRRGNKD